MTSPQPSVPASAFVSVNPGTISAGGAALALSGLFLTPYGRTPIGSVLPFSSAANVGAYYGLSSVEYANALVYFAGATKATATPAQILFAQYNQNPVPAYLRGGSLASMSLASLQALSGTLVVTVDGAQKTSGTINLSGATSFSNAASLIQTGFGAYDGVTSSAATIAAGTALVGCTGSISGFTLTVSALTSGTLVGGGVLSGTGVTSGTAITAQLTGTAGGIGTYTVSASQTVASTTLSQSYGVLTATVSSGFLAPGQVISGGTTATGTQITAQLTGTTGGSGTYVTSGGSQTVSATTISAGPLTCTFDSVSSAFVLVGGTPGVLGSMTFATGTLAASLNLATATGAVLSQGAAAAVPGSFMGALVANTTAFASFTTVFDPDNGVGNAQKQAFAAWNTTQNDRYLYVAFDTDVNPTLSNAATSSLGYLLEANGNSGSALVWQPSSTAYKNAFVCGGVASIDFSATNGATSFGFLSQAGLTPDVTSQTVMSNLQANGYSCYVQAANANNGWSFLYPGSVTGPFGTIEAYVNQIWLNNNLQTALMTLLTTVKAVPYVSQGYGLIVAACQGPINQALNFGAIVPGVTLSPAQVAEVNFQAGKQVAQFIVNQGYYLQVIDPGAVVRGQSGSPVINLWYASGGSVLQINMGSIDVL